MAIIYGASGSIGGTVARTFADESASVFLAGRTESPLNKVANDICSDGSHTAGNPVLKPNPQTGSMDSRKPHYVIDVIL